MAAYNVPEWAANGTNCLNMSIEVIKGGVIVDTIELKDKSHFVAGIKYAIWSF